MPVQKIAGAPAPPRGLLKLGLLAGASAMSLHFVAKYGLVRLTPDKLAPGPEWAHTAPLWLHVLAGSVALLIGPLQFSSRIRKRRVHLHRAIGKTYLAAVAVSLIASVYLIALPGSSLNFQLGVMGLILAWGITTGFGFAAIRRGLVGQHREWMVRSYVVTFAFVVFRAVFEVLNALEVGSMTERIAVSSWISWSVPLLITEAFIQGHKIWRAPARPATRSGSPGSEPRAGVAAGALPGGVG